MADTATLNKHLLPVWGCSLCIQGRKAVLGALGAAGDLPPPRDPHTPAAGAGCELSPGIHREATGPTEPGTLGGRCHQNGHAAQRPVVRQIC